MFVDEMLHTDVYVDGKFAEGLGGCVKRPLPELNSPGSAEVSWHDTSGPGMARSQSPMCERSPNRSSTVPAS